VEQELETQQIQVNPGPLKEKEVEEREDQRKNLFFPCFPNVFIS
jgi:hypothetical protein